MQNNKVEIKWSGEYPNLCSGEWSLRYKGRDMTYIIPNDFKKTSMNTRYTDSIEEWYNEYPENSNWVRAFPKDVQLELYRQIKKQDFIKGTCGGCL